jgi:hypothetical protein
MSKFRTIFENNLKTAELRRVKIKIDPKYASYKEYVGLEGYIGYILAENVETATVYIEEFEGGSIQVIPISCIQIEVDPKLVKLIQIASEYLHCTKGTEDGDPIFAQLLNSPSAETIELFLREKQCTTDDILNIYKGFYCGI